MKITHGNLPILIMLACGVFFSTDSQATTNIDITGTVVASPCTVNGGDDTLAVNLGNNIQADDLSTPGNGTNWKSFVLKLTDCPASTTSFSVAFSGTTDDDDAAFYKNTGTATHLKLELVSKDGNTTYSNGATLENVLIPADTRAYNLDMKARAVSTGLVMPGTIKGQVQATFTYQ
ncbi:type 1 fimbrial protein [Salmonella enterica]|uniref:Adhesin n=1 Tax=Salmonella enterica subsp. enterica serovar Macclesfield str. S-1643 TaxID=1242107 RepID=A0A2C9P1J2_SALET|nr:fimbrial protein [Salmonella enterica]EAA5485625.1 type 1 fimbrial protein [Salmonella enterica subsp. enterica serovar Kouka]EBG2395037.1 type 1 fimbrial protein [Salmonella enterica subsp. enterica serovar Everleigh]EBS1107712.1 type 1 fimbrial protein [Salmonella enterica subsp. enterica serovar Eingedi]EBV2191428.1 type 1 fimbrial protein [Salmonella enterica subsp. enterica serovar Afula]ASG17118.1 adhesin [Salmonella enterica subsp. enterica serovar Macclesfield str. S-1643]